ncbi:hypothetical protein GCWU000323_02877 [Leptotrichia hofstadii F0254]|uniref:Uncharacterized protein n=1 Tax=Leptotrichia hofstadii F0254 TaxID=634994 RepID=C9N200_9FUSO|nr:hypothetical protein GCWU000323_02877 [Leptotrichia hofstadii F0254]
MVFEVCLISVSSTPPRPYRALPPHILTSRLHLNAFRREQAIS